MNQVIKTYLALALMLIIMLVGAGLIVCAIDAQRAEKVNSGYASTIASHNYSDSSIEQCKNEATADDYELNVKRWDTNNDGHYDVCECVLEYDYTLKFLNSSKNHKEADDSKHHYSRIVK